MYHYGSREVEKMLETCHPPNPVVIAAEAKMSHSLVMGSL